MFRTLVYAILFIISINRSQCGLNACMCYIVVYLYKTAIKLMQSSNINLDCAALLAYHMVRKTSTQGV